MKRAITLFVAMIISINTLATQQRPDIFMYDGIECLLLPTAYETPLMASFFEKHPERKPFTINSNTGLFRAYIATFSIKNETIVVNDIKSRSGYNEANEAIWISIKNQVFKSKDDVPANWFSGVLMLRHGTSLGIGSGDCHRPYSHYILLEVKKGVITRSKPLTFKQYCAFKNEKFEELKKTDLYKKEILEMQESCSDEKLEIMLRDNVVEDYMITFDEFKTERSHPPIEEYRAVDTIFIDSTTGELVLYLKESPPWEDAIEKRLMRIRDRINITFHAIFSGDLLEEYPESKGLKIRFEITCDDPPNKRISDLVRLASEFVTTNKLLQDMVKQVGFESLRIVYLENNH